MRWLHVIPLRLRSVFRRSRVEDELDEELRYHLERQTQAFSANGLAPDDARAAALRAMGGVEARKEQCRDARRVHLLEDSIKDLRYAARMLRRGPGFTAVAVLSLALGIGANTAIFSLVNATLLQRLPIVDPARLVYVNNGGPSAGAVFSYPAYAELRDANQVFDGFAAWGGIVASLNADGATDLVSGAIVSGNFFDVIGVQAARGRVLTPRDDVTPGAHPVAVIGDGLWHGRFGGRSDIVGHEILLNGQRFTIVGVTPPGFGGAQLGVTRDLYVPMMMQAVMRPPRAGYTGEMDADLLKVRTNQWLFGIARVKPGISTAQMDASLSAQATAFHREVQPGAPPRPVAVTPVNDGPPGQRAQMVPVAALLMSVVGAVLLIACANVANLLLSRGAARQREIAIRLAIGAGRGRMIRQMLTESLLLALMGGAAGVLLAWALVRAWAMSPPPPGALPVALDFTIDLRVLLFALGLSVVTGIVFGLAPALRVSRPALSPALKDDVHVPEERGRWLTLRKALVVAEVALSLLLLIAAGLFIQSLRRATAVDPGFAAGKLLIAPLNVNLLRYTWPQSREFYQRAADRVAAIPGVESASVARIAVLTGGGSTRSLHIEGREATENQFQSEGRGLSAAGRRDAVSSNVVGAGYFHTMGIPLRRGRDFGAQDGETAPLAVVVTESFAATHFSNEDPIGKRISVTGPRGPWRAIVGVVRDSKYLTLSEEITPIVYLPLTQHRENGVTLHVRAAGDPAVLVPAVRAALQSLEPNLPVPNIQTMTSSLAASLYVSRMGAGLLAACGALALLLASIGVYGVMAFSIARRTRELGIRMALGAERRDVFSLVIREGMTLVGAGIAIGLGCALGGAQMLAAFLYGVSARDLPTFATVPLVLALVALIACVVPARRASRADPMTALRCD
jgi:predicted permease